jgi:uncharacterized protein (DUF2141 family)
MRSLLMTMTLMCLATGLVASVDQARDAGRTTAPTGTAQIAGRVVSSDTTPVPLRRVVVTLTGDQSLRLVAVTDDAGTFVFSSLPAGRYSMSAAKGGYVPMAYGSKRPGGAGTPIVLADEQRATVTLALPKGAVITGTVRDDFGRPVPNVTVSVLRHVYSTQLGGRAGQSASIGSSGQAVAGYLPDSFPGTAVTDDRGVYRIYGLAAGEYIVSASVRANVGSVLAVTDVHQITDADVRRARQLLQSAGASSPAEAAVRPAGSSRVDYAPVYHPNAIARQDASTVTVGTAEEKFGIDIVLRLVPTATVYGVVTSQDGTPQVNAQVSVMEPDSTASRVLKAALSGYDGEFAIAGVPPGRYQVWSSSYPGRLSGTTEVVVNGRDVDASFMLGPGGIVSGRIVFDGTATPPAANTIMFLLQQMPRNSFGGYSSNISPDGTFVFSDVPAGFYRLRINGRPPAGWALRSVTRGGADADVSDVLFEVKAEAPVDGVVIALTDRPAEISGTLQTATGAPAPDYVLVVFSADSRYWVAGSRRTQQVRPDVQGRYVAQNLPAGDYLIAAVTDLEDGQWNDPAFLAELAAAGAVKVTLAEGDQKVQDIRISGQAQPPSPLRR